MHVSQKIFIKNKEGKYLTIRRSDTDPNRPLTWDMPGGQLEVGEELLDSLEREIKEEIGLEGILNITLFGAEASNNKEGEYWLQLGYHGELPDPAPQISLSYEHDQLQWLTLDEFLALESSAKLVKLAQKLSLK